MAIALPDAATTQGAEVRVLLAEVPMPSAAGYTLELAKTAMQYMDAVVWNRTKKPTAYGAKRGAGLVDIIKARGQFAGFENYPTVAASITKRLKDAIDIANAAKDRRSAAYIAHINAAIERANANDIDDPSPGDLTGWRTAGHGLPGSGFTAYQTVLGNTFYWVPYVERK